MNTACAHLGSGLVHFVLGKCVPWLQAGKKLRLADLHCSTRWVSASSYSPNSISCQQAKMHSLSAHAKILDGRAAATKWKSQLKEEAEQLTRQLRRPPGLSVILVGSRPDSLLYVNRKQESCQKVGIRAQVTHLAEGVSQGELEGVVRRVCADPLTDGVLIQLPLPRHLDEEAVMEVLDPRKDVDGFHPINMGRLVMRGRRARYVPCTPLGCMQLLRDSGVEVKGRRAVVVGDSNIVGTPLAVLLREEGAAAVTICHRLSYQEWFEDEDAVQSRRAAAKVCLPRLPGPNPRSRTSSDNEPPPQWQEPCFQSHQLPDLTREADILVVAVGHAEMVKKEWVKPGAVVVDVGINVVDADNITQTSNRGSNSNSSTDSNTINNSCSKDGSHTSNNSSSSGYVSRSTRPSNNVGGSCSEIGHGVVPAPNPQSYHIVGDVHFGEVSQVASAITPVPGGVGPMTIAGVLHNTLQAARYNAGIDPW